MIDDDRDVDRTKGLAFMFSELSQGAFPFHSFNGKPFSPTVFPYGYCQTHCQLLVSVCESTYEDQIA